MYFRLLQKLYDEFARSDRDQYEQNKRKQDEAEHHQRKHKHQYGKLYETIDGAKAAEVVERNRIEAQGDGIPFDLNKWKLTEDNRRLEAHEQAAVAQWESDQEEWREAFRDFDKENLDNRITRLATEIDGLFARRKEFEEPEQPKHEIFTSTGRRAYQQMALLKQSEVPITMEVPTEDSTVEDKDEATPKSKSQPEPPHLEVDWDMVNQVAKNTTDPEQARRFASLTADLGKDAVADFWLDLANEIEMEQQEISEEDAA